MNCSRIDILKLFTLAGVLLAGVGCGGSAPTSALNDRGTPKAEYAEAVKAASAAGIVVTCDKEGEITFLDFHAHPEVSEAATHVAKFPNVKMLNFSSSRLADADLVNIAGATQVEQLGLHGTSVTDAGLDHLAGMTKLQQLNLTDTAVTDAGVAKLSGITALTRIDLQNTKVTDASIPHLEGLSELMYIQLSNTEVTDEAVEGLKGKFPDAMIINEEIADTSNKPMLTDAELPDV